MSLLDALLLEGYRDPREVYIALRADGQKGSGTIDDPYDGGTRLGPAFAGATIAFEPHDVMSYCFSGHGLSEPPGSPSSFSLVNVTGLSSPVFNGPTFTVAQTIDIDTQIPSKTFRFRLGTTLPLEAPPAPATLGSFINLKVGGVETRVRKLAWPVAKITGVSGHGAALFDVVEISGATLSYLNGRFVVVGVEADSLWVQLSTAGSGAITTTVASSCSCSRVLFRFDEVMRATVPNSLIHMGPGTFETRGACPLFFKETDHSFDVGFRAKSGQKLRGSGMGVTTLKLVYAIEPDDKTVVIANHLQLPAPNNYLQHFEASDFTVDCNLAGQPVPAGIGLAPVVCGAVNLYGDFNRIRRVRAINWGDQSVSECFVLFISGAYQDPDKGPVNNIVEDCVVENPGLNLTKENTLIAVVGDAVSANGRSLIARNNFVNGELAPGISSQPVGITGMMQVSSNPTYVKITTKQPHRRSVGQSVVIFGLKLVASPYTSYNIAHSEYLMVLTPPGGYTEYDIYARWLPGLPPIGDLDFNLAHLGPDFHPVAAQNGTGCVTEGNAVFDCYNAFYNDTGSTRDAVVRHNYFSGTDKGIWFNFSGDPSGGDVGIPFHTADSITLPGGPNTNLARLTSHEPHLLKVGDVVYVSGARINDHDAPTDTYNGVFIITKVVANNQFEYVMRGNASGPADTPGQSSINYRALWQMRRFSYESNHLDLNPFDANSWTQPFGFGVNVGDIVNPAVGSPPFIFPGCVFRENFIRIRDHASVPPQSNNLGIAFGVKNFENTLIEGNVIDLPNPIPLQQTASQGILAFNNRTAGGTALPLFRDTVGALPVDSVETAIADALTFALL